MNRLTANGRIADLIEAGFSDWQLENAEPSLPSQEDWCEWACAFASLTGELEDLQDDATDADLVELVRRGWGLFQMDVLTVDAVAKEVEEIVAEVLGWGDKRFQEVHEYVNQN